GIAVKELTPGSSNFSAPYGMTFSLLSDGSNTAYLFFADRNGNEVYDGDWNCVTGGNSECLEKVNITRGNYIDSFCVVRQGQGDVCNSAQRVDISFLRPNTESQIMLFNNGGQNLNVPNMLGVKIILKNPRGITRTVSV